MPALARSTAVAGRIALNVIEDTLKSKSCIVCMIMSPLCVSFYLVKYETSQEIA